VSVLWPDCSERACCFHTKRELVGQKWLGAEKLCHAVVGKQVSPFKWLLKPVP